jgi:predicted transcriptional regulator
MLTWEENVEASALRSRGWTISAIARHLGRDRKTIRAYLTGKRTPGKRHYKRSAPWCPGDLNAYEQSREASVQPPLLRLEHSESVGPRLHAPGCTATS